MALCDSMGIMVVDDINPDSVPKKTLNSGSRPRAESGAKINLLCSRLLLTFERYCPGKAGTTKHFNTFIYG